MTFQTFKGIQLCIFTNIYYKIFSEYFSTILVHTHVPNKTHTVGVGDSYCLNTVWSALSCSTSHHISLWFLKILFILRWKLKKNNIQYKTAQFRRMWKPVGEFYKHTQLRFKTHVGSCICNEQPKTGSQHTNIKCLLMVQIFQALWG